MTWKTAITKVEPNKLTVRGRLLSDLIGEVSFGQMVFFVLMGVMPSENVGKMIEAILVASVDHGPTPPSTNAARQVAACRSPLTACLSAGLLAIGKVHGGAIEDCMRILGQGAMEKGQSGKGPDELAEAAIARSKETGQRLPGFGHRIHTDDPRTKRLLELARELGLSGEHIDLALAIERKLEETTGKRLPLNVDGCLAAVLSDIGIPPELGNAFFVMGRVPGLIAHIVEEQSRERPMRTVVPAEAEYDGP
jgi:citrate synthase